ncbi:MAG: phospholipase D family protein [Limisphaerales bacterium]
MSQNPSRLHLHDRLKKHAFEHALITTYNFGGQFFEDYALENFKSLQDNGNISVLLDHGQYQDLLQAATENPDMFPKLANIRYLLHPIRVPGVFHPKVSLFAGKKRGLLLIGSANFTQDGLGSNAELVAAFDFEADKNEKALPLFQSAFRFFEALADRWPSEQLRSNLNTLLDDVPWMSQPAAENPDPELPVLLSNLETPLWDQLMTQLPAPATHLSVLSRFYDARPALVDHVFQTSKAKGLTLYTQNGITTLTKAWLEVPAFVKGALDIRLCHYTDGDHFQHLHGKAYALACGKEIMLAMGSANFTEAAPAPRRRQWEP